jgi:hypothetical protein
VKIWLEKTGFDRNSATVPGTPRVSPVSLNILAIIRTSTTSTWLPSWLAGLLDVSLT